MNEPKKPTLPDPETTKAPPSPHPLDHPDERKEGGPDHGKADKQHENKRKSAQDAEDAESP
ncbi:hypothetical protein [Plastoroseomonas arctica]|uniref:Uncharacterized protein n=1 Tax=Plastoroseomonas arctica TaxID=1509237 RepID=A0AAF1K6B0_9PROT|nr:hypothetical protein [Plastoroseomonas arctica]MBR0656646.1 hypothetical protein [Plastoroseomonas arctica]